MGIARKENQIEWIQKVNNICNRAEEMTINGNKFIKQVAPCYARGISGSLCR